ncbi:endonuclease domain-containing 1 protein-like [Osmerus eperlanus]|uniref:endonuclease domain-containing 1 protein-like n=1 Tax=Osmerus eperlanus TaxID=29151 RepID=UPI002E1512EB
MGTTSFLCLSLVFTWGVSGEVADNFNNCKNSFFRSTPVSGLNIPIVPTEQNTDGLPNFVNCLSAYNVAALAHICQRDQKEYYFATLYDRGRRIPLYSAYEVDIKGKETGRGRNTFYQEPQLVHSSLPPNQMDVKSCKTEIKKYNNDNGCNERFPQYQQLNKIMQSQAVDGDFVGYDRGHLNPAGHHSNEDYSSATTVFTNVAPQNGQMNNGKWNEYEKWVRKYGKDEGCDKMYAVVGVVPSDLNGDGKWLKRAKGNAVNVPSHYWSAYCCTNSKDEPILSGGAICPNLDITNNSKVKKYNSVGELENELQNLKLGNNFKIFASCVAK